MKPWTYRSGNAAVVAFSHPRLDAQTGARLVSIVQKCMAEGVQTVVFDLDRSMSVDVLGAHALARASALLGYGQLRLVGLSGRARMQLRALHIADDVWLYDWWSDAVGGTSRRAA